jgi:hypothetical protein
MSGRDRQSTDSGASPREVRLRREFAALYEEIPAELWLPARQVAELTVQRASSARRLSISRRTLDPKHFEFRGGAAEVRPGGVRGRLTDPPGQGSKGRS